MVRKRILIISIFTLIAIFCVYLAYGLNTMYAKQLEQEDPVKNQADEAIVAEAKARVDNEKAALEQEQILKAKLADGSYKNENLKIVFLTFDDGPDTGSNEVLDILKANDVQATFFTNGRTGEENDAIYRRIVNEGHTLANHTWSHEYSLYKNPDALMQDIQRVADRQREATGIEPTKIFRFPGGSTTANQTCVDLVTSNGYNFFDWNVENGDGLSNSITPDQSFQRIVDGCHANSVSVVLTHAERPVKAGSRQSLDRVIKTLKSEGYTFMPLDASYNLARFMQPTGTPTT